MKLYKKLKDLELPESHAANLPSCSLSDLAHTLHGVHLTTLGRTHLRSNAAFLLVSFSKAIQRNSITQADKRILP